MPRDAAEAQVACELFAEALLTCKAAAMQTAAVRGRQLAAKVWIDGCVGCSGGCKVRGVNRYGGLLQSADIGRHRQGRF